VVPVRAVDDASYFKQKCIAISIAPDLTSIEHLKHEYSGALRYLGSFISCMRLEIQA
jgi:hypothetical protein